MADPAASGAVLDVPALAKELGERFAAAGHELYLVGGSVRDLVLGRAARRTWTSPRRAPVRHHRDPARLGRPAVPRGRDVRHGRRDEGRAAGDHHLPAGGVRGGAPQARGHVRQGPRRPTCPAATSRSTRWRSRCPTARSSTPSAASATSPRRSSTRRWTPRSRSPTIRCGWCVRRGSWPSSTSRPTQRVVDAMRAMRGRLEIVSAERIRDELDKLLVAPAPGKGLELARRDRRSPTGSCPSSRRCSSNRTRCTGTRTCCATPTPSSSAPSRDLTLRHRGAAARRREARHPRDHRRRRAVPPPRGGGRAHGATSACASSATPTT